MLLCVIVAYGCCSAETVGGVCFVLVCCSLALCGLDCSHFRAYGVVQCDAVYNRSSHLGIHKQTNACWSLDPLAL